MKNNIRTNFLYTFSWSVFTAIMLLLPMQSYPGGEVTYYDKFVHFFLFGFLAYLVFRTLKSADQATKRSFAYSFAASFSFAAFLEYLQNFAPGRTVDELDLLSGALGAFLFLLLTYIYFERSKPKLLLHICCIGCGVFVSRLLQSEFRVRLYFYNPNIFPKKEYEKRLEEIKKVAKFYRLKVIIGDYDHKKWRAMIRGYEAEPERGERCMLCYRERLATTAKYAQEHGFDYFATTLTTSPHKVAGSIMRFGSELAREYEIGFLERDFKKRDGFKKAAELSRQLELYRQDYCGCEFSLAEAQKRKDKNHNS